MLRGLLAAVLVLGAIHLGYSFTSPMIKNSMLEAKMKDIANNPGMRGENELRRDVMAFADEKGIPLASNQLQVTIRENEILIGAHYKTRVEMLMVSRDYEFFPASSLQAQVRRKSQLKTRKRS